MLIIPPFCFKFMPKVDGMTLFYCKSFLPKLPACTLDNDLNSSLYNEIKTITNNVSKFHMDGLH
jgi:hypothetical protein